MFACALCLYRSTPGWGVRCGKVCLCWGFGCALPLLAGVLGCVCVCVCAPLVPRPSWLRCAVWVCVLGLGLRLRPATPGWGVWVCVCVCVRIPLVRRHSWLGCPVCVGLLGPVLWLCPATPGRAVWVCVSVRALLVPRHSWLHCAVWVCVFGLGSRLRPATPGWGVGVCVCLCARSASTAPLLPGVFGCVCVFLCALRLYSSLPAEVCGVGVCVWACVWVAPRHSWLECRGLGVFGCALGLYLPLLAGVCGVGGCAWAFALATPHHSWLGCWGVCVGVRAPLVPCHSWLGCWGVCVCFCARSNCTPSLLARVCGVGACVWACVSFEPATPGRDVGFVCVCLRAPLIPATAGWAVRCRWVCLGICFSCTPPHLARVFGCVCLCARSACTQPLPAGVCSVGVCVWAWVLAALRHSWLGCSGVCVNVCTLRLYSDSTGWGVRCGCVCSGLGFACAPPLLPGVLGCVCVCVRAPLVPCHSWPGSAVWAGVFGLGLRLRCATLGWGVELCVCLCAQSACTPPLLAGVCGVDVCVWA